jgi:hypothetical protein
MKLLLNLNIKNYLYIRIYCKTSKKQLVNCEEAFDNKIHNLNCQMHNNQRKPGIVDMCGN